jgi:CRISPR-associated protein (TIGR02710 family)
LSDKEQNNLESIFIPVNELIGKLLAEGFTRNNIYVDFTSGTKPMSAGLAVAGITNELRKLIYTISKRDKNTNRIIGIEGQLSTATNHIFALKRMEIARTLAGQYQYAAATGILNAADEKQLQSKQQETFCHFKIFCTGMNAWDAFDHTAAAEMLKSVRDKRIFKIDMSFLWRGLNRVLGKDKRVECSSGFNDYLITDLWNNAARRLEEERHMDALARLYRLTEMLAQRRLEEQYGIKTSDVDPVKIPERMQEDWELRKKKDGKLMIGLDDDYRLLAALGDLLGTVYTSDGNLRRLLQLRNNSIWAHGTETIKKSDVAGLQKRLQPLMAEVVKNWQGLTDELLFPSHESYSL